MIIEGFKNAVSKLYSSVCKAAKAFGYKKVITYTLATETGSSMKAVGFKLDVKHPTTPKFRWVKNL